MADQAKAWGCGPGDLELSARRGPTEGRVAVRGLESGAEGEGAAPTVLAAARAGRDSENHLLRCQSCGPRDRTVRAGDGVSSCPRDAAMSLH